KLSRALLMAEEHVACTYRLQDLIGLLHTKAPAVADARGELVASAKMIGSIGRKGRQFARRSPSTKVVKTNGGCAKGDYNCCFALSGRLGKGRDPGSINGAVRLAQSSVCPAYRA